MGKALSDELSYTGTGLVIVDFIHYFQVVVLQEYYNNSVETLEAKYVFPLGDMAAVCGFEAFINGKHIVGEVKEKETAHKEYKKAVSEGHGAYLMDQDEETPVNKKKNYYLQAWSRTFSFLLSLILFSTLIRLSGCLAQIIWTQVLS